MASESNDFQRVPCGVPGGDVSKVVSVARGSSPRNAKIPVLVFRPSVVFARKARHVPSDASTGS
jgi:hypothetical protein